MRLSWIGCFGVLFCLFLTGATGWAADSPGPNLRLEVVQTAAGEQEVFVCLSSSQGGESRRLLRRTPAAVTLGPVGADPQGKALFAVWEEMGSPDRWFAFSRDAGANWSAPRSTSSILMLRDGMVGPRSLMPAAPLALPSIGRLFLVQFRTISLPEWRAALSAAGARIVGYFPNNAHLIRINPEAVARVRALTFVERIEPFHPWYRIEAGLRQWLASAGDSAERQRVRAVVFEDEDAARGRLAAAAAQTGATIRNVWPHGFIVEMDLTREQLRQISAHDDLAWVERWTAPGNDMDILREDAGTNWVENNFGYCGTGVRGEVLDAGIEGTHQDFDGIMYHGSHGVDSHGTSTYGMIFGNGNRDGDGEAKATGNIPCAQGIFADYNELGDRYAHTEALKHEPYFASFQSNSWGDSLTTAYTSKSQEMDNIIFKLDIAITQSQSNNGNRQSRPQAWAKNIISVGAVEHKNTLDTGDDCWCDSASIGPAEDGRIKPDVSYWYDDIYTTTTGNGYTSSFGGTSAATPATAGIIGLLVQMWSENVWGTDPEGATVFERQPHAATIKALLVNNAEQYLFSGTTHDLTRVHQGWGRANAKNLKQRAARSFIINQTVPLQLGERGAYDVQVEPGEPELKITMVFPDPPGNPSAAVQRINDLDLTVFAPDGTVFHGNNGLDQGNYSLPGGSPNSIDTVENVFVKNPESGIWRVEIEARELNEDGNLATPAMDAVFALVVTGATGHLCQAPQVDFTIDPNPALVGQSVAFDSTVTGGAGEPYSYRWDFDQDGTVDAETADPHYAYPRPYSGKVLLRVADSAGCPAKATQLITVTGPDLRFAGWTNLVEIVGNGNGAVDPGETVDISIQLVNQGSQTARGVRGHVLLSPTSPGPVALLAGNLEFGDIPAGSTVSSSIPARFQIGQSFHCGNDLVFSLTALTSEDPANTYPDEGEVGKILVGGSGPPQEFFRDGFESSTGWTLGNPGEWQIDRPQGLGSTSSGPGLPKPNPDPKTAFEGTKVLGNDLTGMGAARGSYENNIKGSVALSPPIDCFGAGAVRLEFERWVNVASNDSGWLEVSRDGTSWIRLFDTGSGLYDGSWNHVTFNVADWADKNPAFRIRFGIDSDKVVGVSGWNIDDIRLIGVTRESCEPVSRAKPGTLSKLTVSRPTGGQLQLTWQADCGGTDRASVYRGNLRLGYSSIVPEPDRCDVSGTTTLIPSGAGDADFFLVAPQDGAFEGSYGQTSGGVSRTPPAHACHPRDLVDACIP